MLEFPVPDSGQTLLMKATKLRNKWDFLLNQQLQGALLMTTTFPFVSNISVIMLM